METMVAQTTYKQLTTTRAFIYDREDVVVEFSNDTFSTVFRQYIHGPGIDEPLAILDGEENYIYYLHDGLGSVTGFVGKKDDLLGIYDYASFGEERKNTISFENRYRYTSREYVNDELYYYRARYLRPDLGRFVAMDPLGMVDGPNMVYYVRNLSIEYLDPWGTDVYAIPLPPAGTGGRNPQENPGPSCCGPHHGPKGNGNWNGGSGYQDNVCSDLASPLSLYSCQLACCQEHDRCYSKNGCNKSSWYMHWIPFGDRPCWVCNRIARNCIVKSFLNPACWVKDLCKGWAPGGAGPGPIPGGPGGPNWN